MNLHLHAYTNNDNFPIHLNKSFLDECGISIPEESEFIDDTITFNSESDARRWIRQNADKFPSDIKTVKLFTVFMDKIKTPKGTFMRPGNIQKGVVSLSEVRTTELPHSKSFKNKQKKNEESDEDAEFQAEDLEFDYGDED